MFKARDLKAFLKTVPDNAVIILEPMGSTGPVSFSVDRVEWRDPFFVLISEDQQNDD